MSGSVRNPVDIFALAGTYRDGIESLVTRLQARHDVILLSGDTDWERPQLERRFGTQLPLHFEQTPADKRAFVAGCQRRGATTMMVGDGLNDAGALQQADVGIAVTEIHTAFSPACDAILEGSGCTWLDKYHRALRGQAARLFSGSFAISVLYNAIGLSFAVRGALSPGRGGDSDAGQFDHGRGVCYPYAAGHCTAAGVALMSVIVVLLGFSMLLAGGFLVAFLWAVRSGQYNDKHTPSMRMLFDDNLADRQAYPIISHFIITRNHGARDVFLRQQDRPQVHDRHGRLGVCRHAGGIAGGV